VTDNLTTKNLDIQYSKSDIARANAAKMYARLYKTETETIKPNSNEAVNFYDEVIRAYGDILIACSYINPNIIRAAEKVKGTKEYAQYEAYIAKKRKETELWAKERSKLMLRR
jgi:hypothetical protein